MANDQLENRFASAQPMASAPGATRRFLPPVATMDGTPHASVLIPHRRVPLLAIAAARAALPQHDATTAPETTSYAVADPSVYWG